MNENLTRKQKQLLDYIVRIIREKGYPPTVREMRNAIGVSSLTGATCHRDALAKKGYIEIESTPRGIKLLQTAKDLYPNFFPHSGTIINLPLVGRIQAGVPLLAEQNIEEYIPIPMSMIRSNEDVFLLKVKGDSMVGDHILDGDLVIVKQQPSAENGEIVTAMIDDEATIKRFYKEKDCIRLQPSNERYRPIILQRDVQICGKVIGVLRFQI